MLVLRVTEDHGADSSIADGERLTLPVLGRLIVVQGKPLTVCDGGYDKCNEKGAGRNFHVLFHCAPFITSRRRLCAIAAGGRQNVTMLSYPSQCHFCKEINGTFIVRNGTEIR